MSKIKERVLYPMTFLHTTDLKKTKKFYNGILKLPIALDYPNVVVFKIGKGGYWGFVKEDDITRNPNTVCLSITVKSKKNVDDYYIMLNKKKVKCRIAPRDSPRYGIYTSFYEDPNGYTVEVQTFVDKTKTPKHK